MSIATGTIGNCTWEITDDGILEIEGDGPINVNYTSATQVPWYNYRTSITTINPYTTNDPIGSLDYFFYGCENLTDLSTMQNWGCKDITSLNYTFYGCSSLINTHGVNNFKTSNVTSMKYTFYDCTSLYNLESLANWDTSNVTSFAWMFQGCSALKDISPLSNWNTSKITNMRDMFHDCTSLSSVSALKDWDVSNVRSMEDMFLLSIGRSSFLDLSGLKKWNTSNVVNMEGMFANANIHDVSPISNWNISNVIEMKRMFWATNSFDISALSNWDMSNVSDTSYMFYGGNKKGYLETNMNPTTYTGMFENCAGPIYLISRKNSNNTSILQTIANSYNYVYYSGTSDDITTPIHLYKSGNNIGLGIGKNIAGGNQLYIGQRNNPGGDTIHPYGNLISEGTYISQQPLNYNDQPLVEIYDGSELPLSTLSYQNDALSTNEKHFTLKNSCYISSDDTLYTNNIKLRVLDSGFPFYEITKPEAFRKALGLCPTPWTGLVAAPAVLTNGSAHLAFSIPTGRVYPVGTTITRLTMIILGRVYNSNSNGYYMIKSTSGGYSGASFDSNSNFTFYNANNQSKTINKSEITVSLQGLTNIYVDMNSGTSNIFAGTSTINGYINNQGCVLLCSSINATFNIPTITY